MIIYAYIIYLIYMIYVYIEIFFSFIYLGTINKFLLLFQENILEKKIYINYKKKILNNFLKECKYSFFFHFFINIILETLILIISFRNFISIPLEELIKFSLVIFYVFVNV